MTSPFLQGSGVIPESTALQLLGIQTDDYGEILGGHKALFDFDQQGLTGLLGTNGIEIANLVTGGEPLEVSGAFSDGATIEAVAGVNFTSGGSGENLLLPEVYDLNTLGDEPSIVISNWLTNDTETSTGFPAIMGYARQTNADNQWSINHENTANTLTTRVNGAKHSFVVPLGTAFLLTIFIKKTESGIYETTTYLDDAVVGKTGGKTYPFNTPSDGLETRKVGVISGFVSTWDGSFHRGGLMKVSADAFDIEAWIAEEIAQNSGRF